MHCSDPLALKKWSRPMKPCPFLRASLKHWLLLVNQAVAKVPLPRFSWGLKPQPKVKFV